MKTDNNKNTDIEHYIIEENEKIEQEKEQKFVNLLIEIIVSLTWKELYEESD